MANFLEDKLKMLKTSLTLLKKRLVDKHNDFQRMQTKDLYVDVMLILKEIEWQSLSQDFFMAFSALENEIQKVDTLTTSEMLKESIEMVERILSIGIVTDNACRVRITRSFLSYYNDFNREETISSRNALNDFATSRQLNVLFFEPTYELLKLKKDLNQKQIYAIYNTLSQTNDREKMIKNIAYGVGLNSNISNGVFDVIYISMDSPIFYTPVGIHSTIPNIESVTLGTVNRYLRKGGVLSLIIPYTRLLGEFCKYLAKNFTQFQHRLLEGIMIELTCVKKEDHVIETDDYMLLRNIYKHLLSTTVFTPYHMPHDYKPVTSFRGNRITDDILEQFLEESTCFNEMIDSCAKIENFYDHEPLMPFNIGQLGIIISCGCADGVIQEDENNCHLIKGKNKRVVTTRVDENDVETTITSHCVSIKALTPTGQIFKIQ